MKIPKLTREQAVIIGAYTGVLISPFSDIHEYIEKILGRPVFTHELADPKLMEEIKEAAKADFISLAPL